MRSKPTSMTSSKIKSVTNIDTKVDALLFVLGMLQRVTGFQEERICICINMKDPK